MFHLPSLAPLAFVALGCQESPVTTPPTPQVEDTTPHEHTNALIHETSPYLLQHAHNPVDWHPWGPEALALAKELDKPIFLSIGYSACHWCHVMEEESFENERIAALMNEYFICIKVDREERPDLDEVYMAAVQAMTGSGGWPMSVFLTPNLQPYYGGTYFPPTSRFGRPGFDQVLDTMHNYWVDDREKVVGQGKLLTDHLAKLAGPAGTGELDDDVLERALVEAKKRIDTHWGGFGGAPKFPHTADLELLLRQWKRTGDPTVLRMVTLTLDRMGEGGLFDQLGGGFARYSTDEKWLIPHFEKMMYDNALLVPLYVEAWQATKEESYRRIARETCDWILREMVTDSGGIASSLDADSEGEEGRFYAWDEAELDEVLGSELGSWAAAWYGVTGEGNFEHGKSALWRHTPAKEVAEELGVPLEKLEAAMDEARPKLFRAREARVHPHKDDKVLAAWNGLAIGALAEAGAALGEPRYVAAAQKAARFVLEGMRQENGHLFATARAGRAHLDAYLDDYAFVISGLIDLYEADFDPHWIHEALALNVILESDFRAEDGGYYSTGKGHEELLVRMRSGQDGAMPSGLGVQALNLARLSELTGDPKLRGAAETTLASIGGAANRFPAAFSSSLVAFDFLSADPREVVISGELDQPETAAMLAVLRQDFVPHKVVALADHRADLELMPPLEGKEATDVVRVFVCRGFVCQAPVTGAEELRRELK
jgi:uncharacterized protein YyaL (SSP411 family)